MGRKDAAKNAQQLLKQSENDDIHKQETPVHILEAVSTPRERLWSSTLGELADGKADDWFDRSSPALIMVGEALRVKIEQTTVQSESSSSKINDGLQDSLILANSRRRA